MQEEGGGQKTRWRPVHPCSLIWQLFIFPYYVGPPFQRLISLEVEISIKKRSKCFSSDPIQTRNQRSRNQISWSVVRVFRIEIEKMNRPEWNVANTFFRTRGKLEMTVASEAEHNIAKLKVACLNPAHGMSKFGILHESRTNSYVIFCVVFWVYIIFNVDIGFLVSRRFSGKLRVPLSCNFEWFRS